MLCVELQSSCHKHHSSRCLVPQLRSVDLTVDVRKDLCGRDERKRCHMTWSHERSSY